MPTDNAKTSLDFDTLQTFADFIQAEKNAADPQSVEAVVDTCTNKILAALHSFDDFKKLATDAPALTTALFYRNYQKSNHDAVKQKINSLVTTPAQRLELTNITPMISLWIAEYNQSTLLVEEERLIQACSDLQSNCRTQSKSPPKLPHETSANSPNYQLVFLLRFHVREHPNFYIASKIPKRITTWLLTCDEDTQRNMDALWFVYVYRIIQPFQQQLKMRTMATSTAIDDEVKAEDPYDTEDELEDDLPPTYGAETKDEFIMVPATNTKTKIKPEEDSIREVVLSIYNFTKDNDTDLLQRLTNKKLNVLFFIIKHLIEALQKTLASPTLQEWEIKKRIETCQQFQAILALAGFNHHDVAGLTVEKFTAQSDYFAPDYFFNRLANFTEPLVRHLAARKPETFFASLANLTSFLAFFEKHPRAIRPLLTYVYFDYPDEFAFLFKKLNDAVTDAKDSSVLFNVWLEAMVILINRYLRQKDIQSFGSFFSEFDKPLDNQAKIKKLLKPNETRFIEGAKQYPEMIGAIFCAHPELISNPINHIRLALNRHAAGYPYDLPYMTPSSYSPADAVGTARELVTLLKSLPPDEKFQPSKLFEEKNEVLGTTGLKPWSKELSQFEVAFRIIHSAPALFVVLFRVPEDIENLAECIKLLWPNLDSNSFKSLPVEFQQKFREAASFLQNNMPAPQYTDNIGAAAVAVATSSNSLPDTPNQDNTTLPIFRS